ncbi:hypothetical protein [Paenibacillus albiflavus]|uniref:hypothetical protein n=1 Tax=Paenibacillus albiflavus TaxID=2545760 RepID=UPI00140522AA|nr:hypothetical protein [Paenibacillus albiflavus]
MKPISIEALKQLEEHGYKVATPKPYNKRGLFTEIRRSSVPLAERPSTGQVNQ